MVQRIDPVTVYSEVADLWTRPRPDRRARQLTSARRIVKALRAGGSVLDIGCGTGGHLSLIRREAARHGKAVGRTVGIDAAPAMVDIAARRRGIGAVHGDALELPFVDQAFDVVYANRILHLVGDPARAAREMMRVVLPGGTIIAEIWTRGPSPGQVRGLTRDLPRTSLLRRYLEVPRSYEVASFRRTLEDAGCTFDEVVLPGRPMAEDALHLARIARASGTLADVAVARRLEDTLEAPEWGPVLVLVARVPGPRTGGMPIRVVDVPRWTPARVRRLLADLPQARGYRVVVKPQHWRKRPHVQAYCDFEERCITIQVPKPFEPFCEDVPYRAKRLAGKGLRFRWYRKRLWFERPDELIRYLYLHEYYHWFLREALGRPSAAETACDRFALQRL